MKTYTSIGLIIGIILLINVLSEQFFFRLDLTQDKQYTLSKATKNILKELEDPVTVTAYFSDDLPPDIAKTKRDFQEMLLEYSNLSKGNVDYEFISPETDEEKQEALQNGVRPVMINVREKDQMKQQQAFLGAVLQMGEQKDVIPFIQPGTAMEYSLSTGIKKISVVDKPSVGLLQGHGEPSLSQLAQAYEQLSILYNVENIDLNTEDQIAERFRAVAIIAPVDSFAFDHLQKLDDYLCRGGNIFVAINTVEGDLSGGPQGQTPPSGFAKSTLLESWLREKGVEVEPNFVVDASSGAVTVQQRQGFFTMNSQVKFPFLPLINTFPEHPINKGLEQVILPFASPIRFLGDSTKQFTPIAQTSTQSGIVSAPTYFDVQKQWTKVDFPMSNLTVGGVLEGKFNCDLPAKMVVIGDGDFAVTGEQGGGQNPDNISLMVNSIDWLSDDTGLIELRTKGVTSRPIDQEYLAEEENGKRTFLKWLNFGLPIILVLIYGFIRMQRQRNIRMQRMQERYI
ncbi:MAG: hypothetical protein GY705_29100 [Bacteroidetes bacterium]|nr:hypothetical protein [Bacteroidota bacterium]